MVPNAPVKVGGLISHPVPVPTAGGRGTSMVCQLRPESSVREYNVASASHANVANPTVGLVKVSPVLSQPLSRAPRVPLVTPSREPVYDISTQCAPPSSVRKIQTPSEPAAAP